MSWRPCSLSLATAFVLFGAPATAALVAHDGFEDYAAGVQVESSTGAQLNGGTGFSAPYNANDSYRPNSTIASAGLSYSAGGVSIQGGSRALNITGVESVIDKLVARPFTSQTSTVYFSFLYRTNNPATSEDFIQIGFSNAEDGEPKISVGTGGGTAAASPFFIRIPNGTAGNSASSTTLQPDTTYLLVGKISKSGVTNYDQLALYLNPTTVTEPATPLLSRASSSTIPAVSYFIVRTARVDSTDRYQLDELRIGTTYADVIPEPVSLSTASVIGSLLLLRRRR